MKQFCLLFILAICFASTSCDKCKGIACTSPPQSFRFKIMDEQGKNITNSNDIKIAYQDNQTAKYITLTASTGTSGEALLTSNDIGWLSVGSSKIQGYSLVVNGQNKGILIYDNIAVNENCCSFFKTNKIQFNEFSLLDKLDKDFCYLLVVKI